MFMLTFYFKAQTPNKPLKLIEIYRNHFMCMLIFEAIVETCAVDT
jgi:hypothetical protein